MANLNELFPKNNWAADGALGGFLGGMQVPYALRQADNDEEISRLKQQQMRLANQFDEYDMPNKKAGSDTGVVEQLLKKKLIDSGVTEDSVRTKLEGDKLHNKSQVQKMDEETRNQRNQDITEMNAFFQKVPEGAQMTEPVQQRWKEWASHINTKYGAYGMKIPEQMDLQSKDALARVAAAAASSPQHTQKMEAQTQGEKSREKQTDTRATSAQTIATTMSQARVEAAKIAMEAAGSKLKDRASIAEANSLVKPITAKLASDLAQVDARIEQIKANNSIDPAERENFRVTQEAEKAKLRAEAMEKITAVYNDVAERRGKGGESPTSVNPKAPVGGPEKAGASDEVPDHIRALNNGDTAHEYARNKKTGAWVKRPVGSKSDSDWKPIG